MTCVSVPHTGYNSWWTSDQWERYNTGYRRCF